MKKIDSLLIEVTSACNLRCIHCGYKYSPNKYIDYQYVVDVIEESISFGLKTVMLTGGEPTLYPNLYNILKVCKKHGLFTKLTTNGYRLSEVKRFLDEDLLDQIVVSMDARTEKTYERIRGKNLLPDIWNDIDLLSDYRNRIHCSYLIQKLNYQELIPFLKQCEEKRIKNISLLVPHSDGDFTHQLPLDTYYDTLLLDDSAVEWFEQNAVQELRMFYAEHKEMFHFDEKHLEAIIMYLTSNRNFPSIRESVCSLPLRTVFIYADKSVRMCPYQIQWTYSDFYEFIDNIQKERMKLIFVGSKKNSLCRCCLEVPLGEKCDE